MNELSDHNVHGWLMDVPGYRENYANERRQSIKLNDIEETDETSHGKERPSSLISISSEDSINLDELINANFTTNMNDETDLPDLASLDLDDSNEDFWKMDNCLNHLIIPTHQFSGKMKQPPSNNSPEYDFFDSNNTSLDSLEDSLYNNKGTKHDFIHDLSFDDSKLLQVPSSLPASPKSLAGSPIDQRKYHRYDRSDSFSSENSFNSMSTVTQPRQYQTIYPSASTSTSSISSHSTANTANSLKLPRAVNKGHYQTPVDNKSNARIPQPRYRQTSSISETTSSSIPSSPESVRNVAPKSGLARRATHIPAPASPSNQKKSMIPNTMTRTKSTTLLSSKKSLQTLTRSASRIGQPQNRASHIPAPPARSTTSLGISSIFSNGTSSPPQKRTTTKPEERPKTSMGSPKPPSSLGLRRVPSSLTVSKSTKMFNPRTNFI